MDQNDQVYSLKVKQCWIKIVHSKKGIKKIYFPSKKTIKYCVSELPRFVISAGKQLQAYFSGKKVKYYCPLDLSGYGKFDLAVWQAAKAIPYGKTKSYEWIAKRIGKPRSARAVGNALGRNPVPIIIPCHRIIKKDGSLGGFGGGIAWKKRLLELESQKE